MRPGEPVTTTLLVTGDRLGRRAQLTPGAASSTRMGEGYSAAAPTPLGTPMTAGFVAPIITLAATTVICPIWLPSISVNQRLPSGPAVMARGPLLAVGTAKSVTTPAGVIRPIWLPLL